MEHGYSEEEWDDYLAGRSAADVRARIDAHLVGCTRCWEMYHEQSPTMRAVAEAAEEARERLTVADEHVRAMFAQTMASVKAAENLSDEPAEIRSRLDFLKSLLVPVFGPQAAQRAMRLAAHDPSAGSSGGMTRDSWNPFLERLAAIASIICGDVLAGLIREHGRLASA